MAVEDRALSVTSFVAAVGVREGVMGETVLEGVVRVLRESGLTDRPGEFDSDIHPWRCSHPDIYGRCDCFQELAEEI